MGAETKRRKRLETPLAAAVAHPVRSKCLVILAERVASPAEIARELNLDVSNVGYHVNGLLDAKLIEPVDQRQVRGAVEHFYRAVQLPIVDNDQEAEIPEPDRRVYAESVLSIFAANAANSLATGAFTARTDHFLSRHAINVDEEGWLELGVAYQELFDRIFAIKESSTERMTESDEKPNRVVCFQSFFEAPAFGK